MNHIEIIKRYSSLFLNGGRKTHYPADAPTIRITNSFYSCEKGFNTFVEHVPQSYFIM